MKGGVDLRTDVETIERPGSKEADGAVRRFWFVGNFELPHEAER